MDKICTIVFFKCSLISKKKWSETPENVRNLILVLKDIIRVIPLHFPVLNLHWLNSLLSKCFGVYLSLKGFSRSSGLGQLLLLGQQVAGGAGHTRHLDLLVRLFPGQLHSHIGSYQLSGKGILLVEVCLSACLHKKFQLNK